MERTTVVDVDNQVAESNEENNGRTEVFGIRRPTPTTTPTVTTTPTPTPTSETARLYLPLIERNYAPGLLIVTKIEDTADGACDSDCSLREAIMAANSLPGPDHILVPAGTYVYHTSFAGRQWPLGQQSRHLG